jgi:serine O-acetyltransferase
MHRLSHRLYGGGWFVLARFISQCARWLTGIEIHPGAQLGRHVFIDHGMGVVIGETAEVGDGCTIYQGVTLGGTSLYKGVKRHPTLGKDVIVGAGAKVLGGFTVGDGARIGSNSVVVKPVPPGQTAVGIPARLISEGDATQDANIQAAFSAYGVSDKDADPMQKTIEQLIAQLASQQSAIDALKQQLDAQTR